MKNNLKNNNITQIAEQFRYREFAEEGIHNRNIIKQKSHSKDLKGQSDSYASHFLYDSSINDHLENVRQETGKSSIAGFEGPIWADEIVVDIDAQKEDRTPDLKRALAQTIIAVDKLSAYGVDKSNIQVEFSGKKGFHIRIPSKCFGHFEPSPLLNVHIKAIVQELFENLDCLDKSIYDKSRLIRIPNTRHAGTDKFAVPIDPEKLKQLSVDDILKHAENTEYSIAEMNDDEINIATKLEELKNYIISNLENPVAQSHADQVNAINQKDASEIREPQKTLIPIELFENVIRNCEVLGMIKDKSIEGEHIGHAERLFLATLLIQFDGDGLELLNNLLETQKNFDPKKTAEHYNSMKEKEYKPELCSTVCGNDRCDKIKAIGKKSPIAFYKYEAGKYAESIAVALIINDFRNILRYDSETDKFYLYNNGVFMMINEPDLAVILHTFFELIIEFDKITHSRVSNSIKHLKMDAAIALRRDRESDIYILNFKNCLFDVRTKQIMDHTPGYFSTYQFPVSYDPNAEAPLFKEKLQEIFDGDEDKIDFWLIWMMYCFIPSNTAQKFLVLYGQGRNGKSLLVNILVSLLGKGNCSFENFSDLASDKHYSVIEIRGKYLNVSSELSTRDADTDVIKRLTGGDTISSRPIYGKRQTFGNIARLIVMTNVFPRVKHLDHAFMERILIIEFTKSFADNPDPQLEQRLLNELPGILNLILQKVDNVIDKEDELSLSIPKSIIESRDKFINKMHNVGEFLEDVCTLTKNNPEYRYGCRFTKLYLIYNKWCTDSGYKPVGKGNFRIFIEAFLKYRFEKVSHVEDMLGYKHKNQIWVFDITPDLDDIYENEKAGIALMSKILGYEEIKTEENDDEKEKQDDPEDEIKQEALSTDEEAERAFKRVMERTKSYEQGKNDERTPDEEAE